MPNRQSCYFYPEKPYGHCLYRPGLQSGRQEKNLTAALFHLVREPRIILEKLSSFIETKPYGVTDQPDFLNGCCRIWTDFSPRQLLTALQAIEDKMGRVRTRRWGERIIDLDILLYDDITVNDPDLVIPHPDMKNRAFVLEPLKEIAPDLAARL